MGFIILDKIKNNNKKIMIFVEGTILKPRKDTFFSRIDLDRYIPIGNAIEKIKEWQEIGYEIIYLTSRKGKGAMRIARLIDDLGFVGSMVGYREKNQSYSTLIKEEQPDILIEDDCKSIGGDSQMCINNLPEEYKNRMKSIVVHEFEGIDNIKIN